MKHFSPEDLTVKVQEDFVEIHGKHNERQVSGRRLGPVRGAAPAPPAPGGPARALRARRRSPAPSKPPEGRGEVRKDPGDVGALGRPGQRGPQSSPRTPGGTSSPSSQTDCLERGAQLGWGARSLAALRDRGSPQSSPRWRGASWPGAELGPECQEKGTPLAQARLSDLAFGREPSPSGLRGRRSGEAGPEGRARAGLSGDLGRK